MTVCVVCVGGSHLSETISLYNGGVLQISTSNNPPWCVCTFRGKFKDSLTCFTLHTHTHRHYSWIWITGRHLKGCWSFFQSKKWLNCLQKKRKVKLFYISLPWRCMAEKPPTYAHLLLLHLCFSTESPLNPRGNNRQYCSGECYKRIIKLHSYEIHYSRHILFVFYETKLGDHQGFVTDK